MGHSGRGIHTKNTAWPTRWRLSSNGPIWMRCTSSCGPRFSHGLSQSWEPNLTRTCMVVCPFQGSSAILPIWRPTSNPKITEKANATECEALHSGRGWEGSGYGSYVFLQQLVVPTEVSTEVSEMDTFTWHRQKMQNQTATHAQWYRAWLREIVPNFCNPGFLVWMASSGCLPLK